VSQTLPPGWTAALVREVGDVVTGTTPSTREPDNWGGDLPFVTPGDIVHLGVTEDAERGLTARGAERARILPPGSVLITCIGNLGRSTVAGRACASNQQINAVLPRPGVDSRFLMYAFSSPRFQEQLQRAATSTTLSLVNKAKFCELTVPLAPLSEQRGIVERIEEPFSRLDAAEESLESGARRVTAIRAARLGELMQRWPTTSLLHVIADKKYALKAGPFGSALKKSDYTDSGFKIYGQEQVLRNDAHYGDYFIGRQKFESLRSCAVAAGDVLISLVGTPGKALVLPDDSQPGIINPRLVKVTLNERVMTPQFFCLTLAAPAMRERIHRDSHGGTMEILNLSILKQLPFPLPSLANQHAIVDEMARTESTLDAVASSISSARRRGATLRKGVLREAFAGRLVPSDRSDSQASLRAGC
jgi:type I restriction enzyme S subunit